MSNRLREKYPQDMTIVLQHQFWDLAVTEHGFEVGLSFSGVPERLLVPFDAVTGFFDPSVQFGLKFELNGAGETAPAPALRQPAPAPPGAAPPRSRRETPPKKPIVPVTGRSAAPKLAAKPAGTPRSRQRPRRPRSRRPRKPADPAPRARRGRQPRRVPQEELSSAGTGRAREPAARNRNVIGSPPSGRSVTRWTGMTSCPASERRSGPARTTLASTMTASCSEKDAPMQTRGPAPNGR